MSKNGEKTVKMQKHVNEKAEIIKFFTNCTEDELFHKLESEKDWPVIEEGHAQEWYPVFQRFESILKNISQFFVLDNDLNIPINKTYFQRDFFLRVLRFSSFLFSQHSSRNVEHHLLKPLRKLLRVPDAELVCETLALLAAFPHPVQSRDHKLLARLLLLAENWGGKQEGVGLLLCSDPNADVSGKLAQATTLHFEFFCGSRRQIKRKGK